MKITLKVNTNDNDRIEVWNSSGCLITILHIDDLFPRKEDRTLRETFYGEKNMAFNLEEAIDG